MLIHAFAREVLDGVTVAGRAREADRACSKKAALWSALSEVDPQCLVLDVAAVRADFPALAAARPRPAARLPRQRRDDAEAAGRCIDALRHYYEHDNANVHRGVHVLSERATEAYEGAREIVRAFVNARSVREIIFTRNATEGINLVARAWGDANVTAGDEVLITAMEHHSNIVPWQLLCDAPARR